jgi:Holliday junction resolvase RusA-like endonuclease
MKFIRGEIPGVPASVNHLYYHRKDGRRYITNKGKLYKNAVALIMKVAARDAGITEIITVPVAVHFQFYYPTWRGDIDNGIKATLDGMTGVIYKDDGLVRSLTASRMKDSGKPRVSIIVEVEDAPAG